VDQLWEEYEWVTTVGNYDLFKRIE